MSLFLSAYLGLHQLFSQSVETIVVMGRLHKSHLNEIRLEINRMCLFLEVELCNPTNMQLLSAHSLDHIYIYAEISPTFLH